MKKKDHWEIVYTNKGPHEVSWTQEVPETSLMFIHSFNLAKDAAIIDIGGGDSKLVDYLIEEGYTNVTVDQHRLSVLYVPFLNFTCRLWIPLA
jgi:hypothetical protein